MGILFLITLRPPHFFSTLLRDAFDVFRPVDNACDLSVQVHVDLIKCLVASTNI